MEADSIADFELKWSILLSYEEQESLASVWFSLPNLDERMRFLMEHEAWSSMKFNLATGEKSDEMAENHRKQGNKKLSAGTLHEALAAYNNSLRYCTVPVWRFQGPHCQSHDHTRKSMGQVLQAALSTIKGPAAVASNVGFLGMMSAGERTCYEDDKASFGFEVQDLKEVEIKHGSQLVEDIKEGADDDKDLGEEKQLLIEESISKAGMQMELCGAGDAHQLLPEITAKQVFTGTGQGISGCTSTDQENYKQARATLFNRAMCFYKMRRYKEALMDVTYLAATNPSTELLEKIQALVDKIRARYAGRRLEDELAEQEERESEECEAKPEKKVTTKKTQHKKEVVKILGQDVQLPEDDAPKGTAQLEEADDSSSENEHEEKPPFESILESLLSPAPSPQSQYRVPNEFSIKRLPNVSRMVSLKFKGHNGRCRGFFAEANIPPGSLLMSDGIFGGFLDEEHIGNHCNFCFRRTMRPLPCTGCSTAVFCSPACQELGQAKHSFECKYMDSLLHAPEVIRLAHDVISRAGFQFLVENKPDLELAMNIEQDSPHWLDVGRMGIDVMLGRVDRVIEASQKEELAKLDHPYFQVFTLLTNEQSFEPELRFRFAVLSLAMTNFMVKAGFFDGSEDLESDKVLTAKLLYRHCFQTCINAIGLEETVIDHTQKKSIRILSIGKALSPMPCLLNHSCFPNAELICSGDRIAVRTIMPVCPWEEITICYKSHVINEMSNADERGLYLQELYYFDCDCAGCTFRWGSPLVAPDPNLPRQIFCPDCKEFVIPNVVDPMTRKRCAALPASVTTGSSSFASALNSIRGQLTPAERRLAQLPTCCIAFATCGDCNEDLTDNFRALETARSAYQAALQELKDTGDRVLAETLIGGFIDVASKLCPLNDPEVHRAVMDLKTAYLLGGNVYIV